MEVQVLFQAEKFWGKWLRSLKKCKTIYEDSWINSGSELLLPFTNLKYTIDTRKTYRNILDWCIENDIEVHQVDYYNDDYSESVNALRIVFNI
jgi:hypothetical protein